MFFEIGVLKNFAIVNIAKFLRAAFFHKTTLVAASENLSGKHQWQRCNSFIFLINTTE